MKAYKGFTKEMTCRCFKFEEGETYHENKAELCKCGFHACEYPLDCFNYYTPSENVFHEVELSEVDDKRGDDTKIAGKTIKIGARLDIAGIVKASIEYITSRIEKRTLLRVIGRLTLLRVIGRLTLLRVMGRLTLLRVMGRLMYQRETVQKITRETVQFPWGGVRIICAKAIWAHI